MKELLLYMTTLLCLAAFVIQIIGYATDDITLVKPVTALLWTAITLLILILKFQESKT